MCINHRSSSLSFCNPESNCSIKEVAVFGTYMRLGTLSVAILVETPKQSIEPCDRHQPLKEFQASLSC